MITLLAIGVAGGKLNTEYFVLSVRAEAMLERSVVIAGISPPLSEGLDKVQEAHGREP